MKTFAKTTNRKISRRKLSRIHTIDLIWVARACYVREENFRKQAQIREIRERFLPRKFPTIRYILHIHIDARYIHCIHTCTYQATFNLYHHSYILINYVFLYFLSYSRETLRLVWAAWRTESQFESIHSSEQSTGTS